MYTLHYRRYGPDDGSLAAERANELVLKKDRFMMAHGDEKQDLYQEIKAEEKAIAKETTTAYGEGVIAWHIHFAEVFISTRRQREIDTSLADIGAFKVTMYEPGGFDIVLANPPYIRQELIKALKPRLREIFPDTFTSTADLYTYFYARAVTTRSRVQVFQAAAIQPGQGTAVFRTRLKPQGYTQGRNRS